MDAQAAANRIGDEVARRRRALRVTQEELAELAGVSVRSVASIEAGKPTVRLDILLPVLATLGVDVVERIERA
ncbi:MAG TPA: helix-turn-helix domain-containing protein [Protaetiibacter sp.]|jgi:y4mF family transcriptional regulator|nr:helix-turn-helix domain-containing protein [Protaetiibacter sp.]